MEPAPTGILRRSASMDRDSGTGTRDSGSGDTAHTAEKKACARAQIPDYGAPVALFAESRVPSPESRIDGPPTNFDQWLSRRNRHTTMDARGISKRSFVPWPSGS